MPGDQRLKKCIIQNGSVISRWIDLYVNTQESIGLHMNNDGRSGIGDRIEPDVALDGPYRSLDFDVGDQIASFVGCAVLCLSQRASDRRFRYIGRDEPVERQIITTVRTVDNRYTTAIVLLDPLDGMTPAYIDRVIPQALERFQQKALSVQLLD